MRGDLSIEDYWELLKDQHELVHKYFGDLFVPRTEFVEVNTNFGQPNPSDANSDIAESFEVDVSNIPFGRHSFYV